MSACADLRGRFAAGVLDPHLAPPAGVTAWNGASASRFAVYRNNVAVSLIEALARQFPVCRRLVGDEFFRAMARSFVRETPPRSPLLAAYGEAFPDFVATFEPAASVPYLADVARLEYACGLAHHAADAAPIAASRIQDIPRERWADLVFALHPSLQLVGSRWPIVALWATNTNDAEVKTVDLSAAEDALVLRPALEVEVTRLAPGAFAFLGALRHGERLAVAAEAGLAADPAFDIAMQLAGLMSAGLVAGVGMAGDAPHPPRNAP